MDVHLASLQSRKHWPHAELSAYLSSYCPIAVIASDRNHPSHAAGKMAAAYAAKLFKPDQSPSVLDKIHSARNSG